MFSSRSWAKAAVNSSAVIFLCIRLIRLGFIHGNLHYVREYSGTLFAAIDLLQAQLPTDNSALADTDLDFIREECERGHEAFEKAMDELDDEEIKKRTNDKKVIEICSNRNFQFVDTNNFVSNLGDCCRSSAYFR